MVDVDRSRPESVATESVATVCVATARRLRLIGVLGVVALFSTGCDANTAIALGWPDGVTPQAERMRDFWIGSVIAALVVGFLVWGLIMWAVTFHRKKSDELPRQTQYNLPLEILYTVVPFIIVAILFYFTVDTQNYVNDDDEEPDLRVQVVGFQWNWEFRYLENDADPEGEFEPMETAVGTPISTVGSSDTIPILVVPTDRIVQYRLEAQDVIHSFFVPEFLFKRDVFPAPEKNETDNKFQTEVEREGAFVGRCAELCGTYHSAMNFELRALRPELFDQYLAYRARVNPATGQPYTTGDALAAVGCGELCEPRATTTTPFNTDRTAREATRDDN